MHARKCMGGLVVLAVAATLTACGGSSGHPAPSVNPSAKPAAAPTKAQSLAVCIDVANWLGQQQPGHIATSATLNKDAARWPDSKLGTDLQVVADDAGQALIVPTDLAGVTAICGPLGVTVQAPAPVTAAQRSAAASASASTASASASASASAAAADAVQTWCQGDGYSGYQSVETDLTQMSTDIGNGQDGTAENTDALQLASDAGTAGQSYPPFSKTHKLDYGLFLLAVTSAATALNRGDVSSATSAMQQAVKYKNDVDGLISTDCGN